MSTEIAAMDNLYARETIETIKQTVCKGATDAQLKIFLEVCRATTLNPFLREVWFVPSVGIMAGRDGYLAIANRHPQFDGIETRVERDEKNVPIKAVCTVWRKDRAHSDRNHAGLGLALCVALAQAAAAQLSWRLQDGVLIAGQSKVPAPETIINNKPVL